MNKNDSLNAQKSIELTGIVGDYSQACIQALNNEGEIISSGIGTIYNGSTNILLNKDETAWTGNGSYHLVLAIYNNDLNDKPETYKNSVTRYYFFTSGKTLEQLGILQDDDNTNPSDLLPKFNLDKDKSIIPFDSFSFFNEQEEVEDKKRVDFSAINQKDWMKNVPGSIKINHMAIPGTHDAGANYWIPFVWPWAQTQETTFKEQLKNGIRYFDLRIGHGGHIYHGGIIYLYKLTNIIDDFIKYLKEHESETILVGIYWEKGGNLKTFQEWVAPSFQGSRESSWHFSKDIPTLADVRGKLVLIHDKKNPTGKVALNLKDFVRENHWDPGTNWNSPSTRAKMKSDLISKFMNKYYSNPNKDDDKMVMCNWNKQANALTSILWYANWINNDIYERWKAYDYPKGIHVMDYYQLRHVNKIIASPANKRTD